MTTKNSSSTATSASSVIDDTQAGFDAVREETEKLAEEHGVQAKLGKLAAMASLFETQSSRVRGKKRHDKKINAAIDAILDDEKPSMDPIRALCRAAVEAKRAGLFSLLSDD